MSASTSTRVEVTEPALTRDQSATLLGKTMGLLALTAGSFAVGAFLARGAPGQWGWVFLLSSFGLLVGLQSAARRSERAAVVVLLLFGALLGAAVAPVLVAYGEADADALWLSGAGAGLIVAGFGAAGYATRRDLSGLARHLYWALVALVVAGIVLVFVEIPHGALVYSVVGLVVFAALTSIDFQRLRKARDLRTAPLLAASIFLDLLNLFLLLLNLFSTGGRSGGGTR
ncbi:Bax inhibitor-1 family protein [Geodermatophilus sp. SYSU D00814]